MSLFCCAVPQGDLVIEAREVGGSSDYPVARCRPGCSRSPRAAPDVAVVTLQLPANEALAYRAGQYIEFLLKDGKRRAYSIASAPSLRSARTAHPPPGRAACSPTTCSAP
jgi:CDP-4-dehydro-6-deoxyglucose reductase